MTDHVAAKARMAMERPRVCVEQPSWTLELLTLLMLLLMVALLMTLGQLAVSSAERDVAAGERDLWMELALAEDTRTAVRLTANGSGYECVHFRVRREWEVAVAAECQVMGALLQMARAEHPYKAGGTGTRP